ERYGKIDCPECKAMGEMGKISYVETNVNERSLSRIFYSKNDIADFDPQYLMKFAKTQGQQSNILKNFNQTNEKNYQEPFESHMSEIHKELQLSFSGYKNRVTKEELYCQIIPVVQIEFRHMLTNKLHKVTISDCFYSPEVSIDKSSEQIKSNSKDKVKVLN
ncbi:MAG: hypothetical protein ACK45H_08060, partial [Bacteroidota bacterium]